MHGRIDTTRRLGDRDPPYSSTALAFSSPLSPPKRATPAQLIGFLRARGLVVAYNWPDGDDSTTARVVTLWPQG